MTISAALRDRYTSECDIDWTAVFRIEHPCATTRYLVDAKSCAQEQRVNVNGGLKIFTPVPTDMTQPTRNDAGRADMTISWCNIHAEALSFLEEAIVDGTKPISLFYSVIIIGNPAPQIDPWVQFVLTNISVTESVVSCVASSADILNRAFPAEVYRVNHFPGLLRR